MNEMERARQKVQPGRSPGEGHGLRIAFCLTGDWRFQSAKRETAYERNGRRKEKKGRLKEEGEQQDIARDCMYTMYTT
jgi:hypothetical protein